MREGARERERCARARARVCRERDSHRTVRVEWRVAGGQRECPINFSVG